ncbi:hypothetical protein Q5752_001413 [Cryptotrichosporon argae]
MAQRPASPPPAPTLTVTKATPHKDRSARTGDPGSPCDRLGHALLELAGDIPADDESEDSGEERKRREREDKEFAKKQRQKEQGRERQRRKRAKDKAAREAAQASVDSSGLTLAIPADATYPPSAYSVSSASTSYSLLPAVPSPSIAGSFALATPSGQNSPSLISPALSTDAPQDWDVAGAPSSAPRQSTTKGGLAIPRRTKARAASTSMPLGLSALALSTPEEPAVLEHQPKRRRSEDARATEIGLGVFMPPQPPAVRPQPRRTASEPEGVRDVFMAGPFAAPLSVSPPRSPTPPPVPSLPNAYRSGTRTRANTASTIFSQEASQATTASASSSSYTTPAGSMYDAPPDMLALDHLAPAAQFAQLLLFGPKVIPHVRDGLARLGFRDGMPDLQILLERAFEGFGPSRQSSTFDVARTDSTQTSEPTPFPTPVLPQHQSRPTSPQQHQQFTTPAPVRKMIRRPEPLTLPPQEPGFYSPHVQSPLNSPGIAPPPPPASPQLGQRPQHAMLPHHTRTRTLSRLSMPLEQAAAPASAPPIQSVHHFNAPPHPMSASHMPSPVIPTPVRMPATPLTYEESPSAASLQTPSTGQGVFPAFPEGQPWQLGSAPARMGNWNGLESPLVPKRGYPMSAMPNQGGGSMGMGVQMTPTQAPHSRAQPLVHHTPTHFAQPSFAPALHPQTPSSTSFAAFDTPVRSTQQGPHLPGSAPPVQTPAHAQHPTPQQAFTPVTTPARPDFTVGGAHAGLSFGLGDAAQLNGNGAGQAQQAPTGNFFQQQLYLGEQGLAPGHGGTGQAGDHSAPPHHGMVPNGLEAMHATPFSVRQ